MKRIWRRSLAAVLTGMLLLTAVPASAIPVFAGAAQGRTVRKPAMMSSGVAGSVKWTYDASNHTFTVEPYSASSAAMSEISWNTQDLSEAKNGTSKIILKRITKICKNAFQGFDSVLNIDVSNCSVLSEIGSGAFKGLHTYSGSLDLSGTKLEIIGQEAFMDCWLTSVKFPSTLKTIGKSAFEECGNLKSTYANPIVFPDTLESVGDRAFYHCRQIEYLYLQMVKTFGQEAVSNCGNLKSLDISNKISSVKTDSFVKNGRSYGVKRVTFHGTEDEFENIPNLKDNEDLYWTSLVFLPDPGMYGTAGDCDWTLSADKKTLTIKATAGTDCVLTGINPKTVGETDTDYQLVKTIKIVGVKTIDGWVGGFPNVETLELPDSLTVIGDDALSGLASITEITLPDSVEKFGDSAFQGCSSLKKIEIPKTLTSMGARVFMDCVKLETVTFEAPSAVPGIGERAFAGCRELETIVLPDSVETIGLRAFSGCKKLRDITMPFKMTAIGASAFENAMSDPGITGDVIVMLPSTVTSIGSYAFSGCSKLTSVIMGSTQVTKLDQGVFENCTALTNLNLPKTITTVEYLALSGLSSLELLELNGVTEFGKYAVKDCSALKSLYISKKITKVDTESFVNNNTAKTVYFKGKEKHFNSIPNLKNNTDLKKGTLIYTDTDDRQEAADYEKVVLSKKGLVDMPNASFRILRARLKKAGKTYIRITWQKAKGATGYVIYGGLRKKGFKKLGRVGANSISFKQKGLKNNTYYKYVVVAVGGEADDERVVAVSSTITAATTGGKYRNTTAVNLNKGNMKLKISKKVKLKSTLKSNPARGKKYKTFIKVRYESSKPAVATVSKKGTVKAIAKGKCYIYAYAQDGTYKRIRVTVKE